MTLNFQERLIAFLVVSFEELILTPIMELHKTSVNIFLLKLHVNPFDSVPQLYFLCATHCKAQDVYHLW